MRKNVHDNRFAQGFDLTDYAHRQLCASIEHVPKYVCAPTNHPAVYIVETIPAQAQYTVSINSYTCACRRWDDLQVPCIHACKAILARGDNVVKYTGLMFHTSSMIQAYSGRFLPVMRQDLLPEPNRKALKYTTQPGHPKKEEYPPKDSKRQLYEANMARLSRLGHLQNVPVVEVLSTTTHQLVGEPSRQTLHNRTVFSPQTPATFILKVTKTNAFPNLVFYILLGDMCMSMRCLKHPQISTFMY